MSHSHSWAGQNSPVYAVPSIVSVPVWLLMMMLLLLVEGYALVGYWGLGPLNPSLRSRKMGRDLDLDLDHWRPTCIRLVCVL